MLPNKEERIKNYIDRTNDTIKLFRQKKRIKEVEKLIPQINKIRENIEKELGIMGKFLISSDYPQNDEDVDILKKVLEIDEKIVYLIDDITKVKKLKEFFLERVFEINEDLYVLAFVVDIHIFFWDNELYSLLEKYGLNFCWKMHPKNIPKKENLELPKYYLENNKEVLKFVCGEAYKKINNILDWVKFWYGEYLNENEILDVAYASGIDIFFNDIKYSVKSKDFLKALYKQKRKFYEYYRQKNKI